MRGPSQGNVWWGSGTPSLWGDSEVGEETSLQDDAGVGGAPSLQIDAQMDVGTITHKACLVGQWEPFFVGLC